MNRTKQMLLFVLSMGLITSLLLVSVSLLTRERILANQQAALQSAVLQANNISFTAGEVNDIFNDRIEVIELDEAGAETPSVFFREPVSGNVSFQFEGGGVWGPIIGIITLQDDFNTIVEITILEQEETPGLGGIITERAYLDNYVGAELSPSIRISHDSDPNNPNDVDAISGGTRTSERFEIILNTAYERRAPLWQAFTEQE